MENKKAVASYIFILIITIVVLVVLVIFYLYLFAPATFYKLLPKMPSVP